MKKTNIVTHDELTKDLQKRWQALWNKSSDAHFFNGPQWFIACKNAFGTEKYIILTIVRDGELKGVVPLVKEKKFGISVWTSPGERFVDKSSLLLPTKDVSLLREVSDKLSEIGNFYLQEVNEETAKLFREVKNLTVRESSLNYYLPLKDDPYQFMTNKNRNKIRNKIKNNAEHLSYKSYQGDRDGFNVALEMDKRSSKRRQGKSTFVRERERTFFRELLKQTGKDFSVDILFYDKLPIIYGIGFTANKTYNACITAYDDAYAFLSPGKMLHFYLFPRLQQAGVEIFDFSRGITALKKDFTSLAHAQYDVVYTRNRFVRLWWTFCQKAYDLVLHNKILYGAYLNLKKIITK